MRTKTILFVVFSLISINTLAIEKRVALVWGNSNYPDGVWGELPACVNDAKTMDSIFHILGFTTLVLYDGNINEMRRSVKEFSKIAEDADVVVFYYSGHGVYKQGRYYLIPAKTRFGSIAITSDFFPESDFLDVTRNARLRMLFYDACRNELENDEQNTTKGYNPNIVRPQNIGQEFDDKHPTGLVYYCATATGKTEATGSSKLSHFTEVLSKYITYPGNFNDVFLRYISYEHPSARCYGGYYNQFRFNLLTESADGPREKPDQEVSVSITSNAPNAKLIINGKEYEIGKSLLYKVGHTYDYLITADGYMPYNGRLDVSEKTPNNLKVQMDKIDHATIIISSNTKAYVNFDGKYIGETPLKYETTKGIHSVSLSAKGYRDYTLSVNIKQKQETTHVNLFRKPYWYWDNDEHDECTVIGYSYGPQYQIGLNGHYRFEESRFSIGVNIATSTGLFRGLHDDNIHVSVVSGGDVQVTTTSVVNGSTVSYQTTTHNESINSDTYSPDIDPYDEATTYDANFLVLLNFGYNLCNGLMIEAGMGAASHCDKIYLPHYYSKQTITTTDLTTGEVVAGPTTEYVRQDNEMWITNNAKWSPATRIGLKTFIPLTKKLYDNVFITIGGGYTYLFSNKEYSSWDANIGIALTF